MSVGIERRRYMGASGETPLPYDAEIEYIETDGNAYIDTGFKPNQNTVFDFTFYSPGTDSSNWIFGTRNGFGIAEFAFYDNQSGNTLAWRYGYSNMQISGKLSAGVYVFKNTTSSNILELNGRQITASSQSFTGAYNFYIFTLNVNGTPALANIGAGIRFYGGKMWNVVTLVRDFIPVRIGQVGYLYDKVSGELFGNAGSGSFTLGPDV